MSLSAPVHAAIFLFICHVIPRRPVCLLGGTGFGCCVPSAGIPGDGYVAKDVLCCFHHALQRFAAVGKTVPAPEWDAARQRALDGAPV